VRSHELLPLLAMVSPEPLARVALPLTESAAARPKTLLLRGEEIAALRHAAESPDPALKAGLEELVAKAEEALKQPLSSPTKKTRLVKGATPNDYVSFAKYWWPNPDTATGHPYVRRDGEINPDALKRGASDAHRLETMTAAVFTLSLAWAVTRDPRYGERAAAHLNRWFINAKTRQTPHLELAQIVPGTRGGRAVGVIEARRYLYLIDADALLAGSDFWPATKRRALKRWFREFFDWMRTSRSGLQASKLKNNIRVWYDAQCAIYALYLGETELAEKIVREAVTTARNEQIQADGSLPLELERARPYDYVAFNLLGMMALARAGEAVGFDAWWSENEDGRSFKRAMDWMLALARADGDEGLNLALELGRLRAQHQALEGELSERGAKEQALEISLDEARGALSAARQAAAEAHEHLKFREQEFTERLQEMGQHLQEMDALREAEAQRFEKLVQELDAAREKESELTAQFERTLARLSDRLKAAEIKEKASAAKVRKAERERKTTSEALQLFQTATVAVLGAYRQARHDHVRALVDQRERLQQQFSYRLGATLVRARSLKKVMGLPAALIRERRDHGRALSAPDGRAALAPASLPAFAPSTSVVTHTPSFSRVVLQAQKALYLEGMALGSRPNRVPTLLAVIRYVNASGRPLKTGLENGEGALQGLRVEPVVVEQDGAFRIAITNPEKIPVMEIALIASRGDVALVQLTRAEQPRPETAQRWLEEARPSRPSNPQPPSAFVDAAEKARLSARRQVSHLKRRLLGLGFRDRALTDFHKLIAEGANSYLRSTAAWELAVWHANRYTADDAREVLNLLNALDPAEMDEEWTRRAAILKFESLQILGEREDAREVLDNALAKASHGDLHLALTRLEDAPDARLAAVNSVLEAHGLEPVTLTAAREGVTVYDRLHAAAPPTDATARVSVIIPVFNAEATIGTAIRSLLDQTWSDIEILVSDDCSTDGTAEVVQAFAEKDTRVRLVRGTVNSGPYVARNLALQVATGAFVTCNDSDDWSHPRKIEIQVRHLLATPDAAANTSPQARTNEDLVFHRRGNPGFYIQPNMSSLMFRREQVVNRIGYWDSVRFAADSEYTRRIKQVFGKHAIVDLDCGPLSFQRQTDTSLTGSQAFGYHGYKMGARREYEEAHRRFHAENKTPYVGFPLDIRPFPAPEPMLPNRVRDREARRHFDVVIASDFRLPGGTNMSNIEEIKAQRRLGLKTGLVQMSRYDVSPDRPMNDKVAQQIDGKSVEMLVYGEQVACDLLVVRLPWVLEEWQSYIPDIEAKAVRVIVNQPPKRDYGPESELLYHIPRCAEHLESYFGDKGIWRPIGPLVRQALETHHAEELTHITLGDDWHNIIDLGEWRRPMRPRRGKRIRICRHSRDQYVKWPADREELLQIYPASDRFEVHVLGGGETPKTVLGGDLPKNWRVTEFGKMEPRRFLAKFDVFVYYTHPDWVESFGRVIFEAMAVGLPVILPRIYEPLFHEAAIYAEPHEVQARIEALMADEAAYQAQVDRALAYVESHFGYGVHAARIGQAMGRDLSAAFAGSPLDRSELALSGDADALASFTTDALDKAVEARRKSGRSALATLTGKLISDADEAMARGPFSVVDKTSLPPGGDPHDYWHPAPYWHPNPDTSDGLPYVRKDGVRATGTIMYEPDSDRYDRTRLQHLFDDSTLLALAWRQTGQAAYVEKAADHLRRWFIDPATRMNPHLRFAQVKPGHNGDQGSPSGVIEMKDLYYYLDAVRLMTRAGALSDADLSAFRAWLKDYAGWLVDSSQGVGERRAVNNHGLYYDLQAGAIAAYLGEKALLFRSLRDARQRIGEHFAPDGSQPHELTRTTTAHYCCFNFQGWINTAALAERWGVDLWIYETADGRGLKKGAEWLMSHADAPWPYEQIDAFDAERFIPAWHGLPAAIRPPRPKSVPASPYGVKPRFYPHDGIRPYWSFK